MLYEIINISDPYTMEHDDPVIVAAAILLLGEGHYAAEVISDKSTPENKVPILIGTDPVNWFKDTHGIDFSDVLSRRRTDLADALDSVIIGSPDDRLLFFEALNLIDDPDKRALWREKWHDSRRSSINDIGGLARSLARALRKDDKDAA